MYEDKKVFIDKDIWYIPNFLNEEELNYLKPFCDDPVGWYITSRSSSIRNKFIGFDTELFPEGTICPSRNIDLGGSAQFPQDGAERHESEPFIKEDGAFERLESVLPPKLNRDITLQSFWPLDDIKTIDGQELPHYGAYDWHYEKRIPKDNEKSDFNDAGLVASWSIYLNEDFEGGVLEFLDKPYKIYPKIGMLVSIPITPDFTHRVSPVTKGIRHTMYGSCFKDLNDRSISTGDSC